MNKKVISAAVMAALTFGNTAVFAASNYEVKLASNPYSTYTQQQSYNTETLKGKVVMIPAGVSIPALTNTVLSSETLSLGQSISIPVSNNFYYNNSLVAPSGSSINGTVVQVKKAGRAGINGKLMIKFTNIITPYGQMIPISGHIKTDDGTGLLVGGTKADSAKEYAKDVAVGAGAGAVGGVVMGALSGGKVGKGAAYGTAVGAGVGLAKSLWDKGVAVEIPAGAQIDIVIDQPITVTVQQ